MGCPVLASVDSNQAHGPGCPGQWWGSTHFPAAPEKGCGLRKSFSPTPHLRAPPDTSVPISAPARSCWKLQSRLLFGLLGPTCYHEGLTVKRDRFLGFFTPLRPGAGGLGRAGKGWSQQVTGKDSAQCFHCENGEPCPEWPRGYSDLGEKDSQVSQPPSLPS